LRHKKVPGHIRCTVISANAVRPGLPSGYYRKRYENKELPGIVTAKQGAGSENGCFLTEIPQKDQPILIPLKGGKATISYKINFT